MAFSNLFTAWLCFLDQIQELLDCQTFFVLVWPTLHRVVLFSVHYGHHMALSLFACAWNWGFLGLATCTDWVLFIHFTTLTNHTFLDFVLLVRLLVSLIAPCMLRVCFACLWFYCERFCLVFLADLFLSCYCCLLLHGHLFRFRVCLSLFQLSFGLGMSYLIRMSHEMILLLACWLLETLL